MKSSKSYTSVSKGMNYTSFASFGKAISGIWKDFLI
jgi:hypothetical protein